MLFISGDECGSITQRNHNLTLKKEDKRIMAIRLGDVAPDFTAQTTEGEVSFHQWLGNGWGVLFSHPADFTPVCTTELGAVARLKPEFDRRNTKILAISVDPLDAHEEWS